MANAPREWCDFSDPNTDLFNGKNLKERLDDALGEGFHQAVLAACCNLCDGLVDLGVVDRVLECVAAPRRTQVTNQLQIYLNRPPQSAFARSDAQRRGDLKPLEQDRIHGSELSRFDTTA